MISIESLRNYILEKNPRIEVVFGIEGEIGSRCLGYDNGESPYLHFLGLEGNAELLDINSSSPIWQEILKDLEKRRSIYRIVDEENKEWMELVIYENEK